MSADPAQLLDEVEKLKRLLLVLLPACDSGIGCEADDGKGLAEEVAQTLYHRTAISCDAEEHPAIRVETVVLEEVHKRSGRIKKR